MSDTKEISLKLRIEGISNEAAELSKLQTYLKNLNEERTKFMKEITKKGHLVSNEELLVLAAYNRDIKNVKETISGLKKVVDTADNSLARMRAELIEMKKKAHEGSQELNAQMTPAINRLTADISRLEQAQGTFTRNVGNYPTLMQAASGNIKNFGVQVADSMKNLLSFAGIAGAATLVVTKLKDAFAATTTGMDFMNQVGQVSKQMFYDLTTSMTFNIQKMMEANAIAKEMNAIRQGDLIDLVKVKDMEMDIEDLRKRAADTTLSAAEQQRYLNEAIQKESELIKYKLADAKEDLAVLEKSLKLRPEDYKLQLAFAQKLADIRGIQSEQSIRLISKESAAREKAAKDQEKWNEQIQKWYAEIEKSNQYLVKGTPEYAAMQEEVFQYIKAEMERAGGASPEELQKGMMFTAPATGGGYSCRGSGRI